jgi:glucokinase
MGHVIGDLALSHLPFAGIYLVGGVSRAFTPWLDEFGFAEAFRPRAASRTSWSSSACRS